MCKNSIMFKTLGLVALVLTAWTMQAAGVSSVYKPVLLERFILHAKDLPLCREVDCEEVQNAPEFAKEGAEFLGLPADYENMAGGYFVVYTYPHPRAVAHLLYQYSDEQEATAAYERWLDAFPRSALARDTSVIHESENALAGFKGWRVEARDPAGIAYWFVGARGKFLTVVGMLREGEGPATADELPFDEILSIAIKKMTNVR